MAEIAVATGQITSDAERMQDEIAEVASVAEESSASAEQVSASTQQTSAATQEIASSAAELARTAEKPGAARRPLHAGGLISPLPRAISGVGSTTRRDGPASPSSRENSSSAAARPTPGASWAITVTAGSIDAASRMSSKPTSAISRWRPGRCSARRTSIVIRFWARRRRSAGPAIAASRS